MPGGKGKSPGGGAEGPNRLDRKEGKSVHRTLRSTTGLDERQGIGTLGTLDRGAHGMNKVSGKRGRKEGRKITEAVEISPLKQAGMIKFNVHEVKTARQSIRLEGSLIVVHAAGSWKPTYPT